MGIFDIFEVDKLKAELQRARDERDKLKVSISERLAKLKIEFDRIKSERDHLKEAMSEISRMEAYGLKKAIAALVTRKTQAQKEAEDAEAAVVPRRQMLKLEIEDLSNQIALKKKEIVLLDEEALLQSFGFYKPKYDLASSALYKIKLDHIQAQQAQMIKNGTAVQGATTWTLNNSQKEGERMIKDYVKLILRSFNNECDASLVHQQDENAG